MVRPLLRLLRLLAAAVALLQGAVPAAVAVAEGTLADRARSAPALVHAEDGRQRACAYAHPGDCGVCACVAAYPVPSLERERAAPPARIAPPAGTPLGVAAGASAAHGARAPPTV